MEIIIIKSLSTTHTFKSFNQVLRGIKPKHFV